jgi:NAD(P)-dependent dehydrogenase (short-subunit alcohol dehydrogenase family)
MHISLEGKVALVTGGSRGIGKAIAAGMIEAGASVMISSRKQDALDATAAEIGGDIATFAANAGEPGSAEACVAATIERFGRLDILVNNAATNPYYGPTLEVDRPRYDKTFQVNLAAPLFWSQAAYEAALIHLTRQLANELGPNRVVGIAPGLVETDFASYLVDNFGEQLAAAMPLQRLGDPEDIANLAVFLASDKASWITGETYVIDGGAGVRST